MKLFLVNGQGGVGKDTFIDFVQQECAAQGLQTFKYSTVEKLKMIAQQVGWRGEKTPQSRRFLCDFKKITTAYNDFSFRDTTDFINAYSYADAIFLSCREPQDLRRYSRYYDSVSSILVTRDCPLQYGNEADDNVNSYDYDIVIDNSGSFQALKEAAVRFVEQVVLK